MVNERMEIKESGKKKQNTIGNPEGVAIKIAQSIAPPFSPHGGRRALVAYARCHARVRLRPL